MQTVRLIAIGFLSLVLLACGNKGDLYLESESVLSGDIKAIGDSIDEMDELDELDKLEEVESETQAPKELDDETDKTDKNNKNNRDQSN